MVRVAILCVLASVVALGYAENTKCSGEIETFRKCRETFRETQMAAQKQAAADRQKKVADCFTSSGCKAPTSDEPSKQGKGDSKKQCHKDLSAKVHDLMKPCIQKALNIVLQPETNQNEQGGHWEHGGMDFKSLCSTDDQRNKTKACMKAMWGQAKGQGDKDSKAEEKFNANCGNKRQCLAAVSAECQAIFNKTKTVRCDCAKSEIASKSDLNTQFQSCAGGTPRPGKDGKTVSYTERFVKRACDDATKGDICSKPFQPHTHSGEGKFHGGKGHGRGGNHQ